MLNPLTSENHYPIQSLLLLIVYRPLWTTELASVVRRFAALHTLLGLYDMAVGLLRPKNEWLCFFGGAIAKPATMKIKFD